MTVSECLSECVHVCVWVWVGGGLLQFLRSLSVYYIHSVHVFKILTVECNIKEYTTRILLFMVICVSVP